MAIKLTLNKTERILFCGSKWWGDPDMPENMQYPTVEATEDGETFDYPLTFICQINCEDIAPYDKEGRLPKIRPALLADAIATSAGAVLGTSTTTTFVESSAGVAAGAAGAGAAAGAGCV